MGQFKGYYNKTSSLELKNIDLGQPPVPCLGISHGLYREVPKYSTRERERNVLFNDALNTFYLRLYGVRRMVKDHSDSEKGNPLPPHRLLLSINYKIPLLTAVTV